MPHCSRRLHGFESWLAKKKNCICSSRKLQADYIEALIVLVCR